MDINNLSKEERAELLHALKKQEKEDSINRREAYETLRHQFAFDVESKLMPVVNNVAGFREWLEAESGAFRNVMRDYGQLRRGEDKGVDDPMYQLAMTLLERNKQGDLDYKSISKLYSLESNFDEEYAAIMQLFKESNVVYKTAVNYYFYKRDENGVWRRVEPSFCRL